MGQIETTCRATETQTIRIEGAFAPAPQPSRTCTAKTRAGQATPKAAKVPAAYKKFARTFRADLAPEGAVQTLLAERAAVCAWRLKEAMAASFADPEGEDKGREKKEEAAEKSLYKVLEVLAERQQAAAARAKADREAAEAARPPFSSSYGPNASYGQPVPADSKAGSEAPTVFLYDPYREERQEDGTPDLSLSWKDRLTIDESISEDSPVIKGTFVTVRHIVSLIVDGWSWQGILTTHPELTEDDLRACMDYSAEFENSSLDRYRRALDRDA